MKDRQTDGMPDDELDRTLASLPYPSPAPGFADRVMARVVVPTPLEPHRPARELVRAPARTRFPLVAASLVVVAVGSVAASVAWSLSHQALLTLLGDLLLAQLQSWAWDGFRALATGLVTPPTPAIVRELVEHPAHVAAAAAFGSVVYVGGVVALRRLMSFPLARIAHAQG